MNSSFSLSEQLVWATRAVTAVQQGRSLTEALGKTPVPLRPGVQALAFHALRQHGQTSVLLGLLAPKPPQGLARALLGVALALLLPQAAHSNVAYAPHTVVDQAVAALRPLRLGAGVAGFVNACLRRYLREQADLHTEALQNAEARWNHPFWWVQKVRRDHPQHWQAILSAGQQPAPMVLRVNQRQGTRDRYLADLQRQGLQASPIGEHGIVLAEPVAVERLPGWHQGRCSVQDLAAQWAAPGLLSVAQPVAGRLRILDACAAPGGKTAHLLEQADAEVLALEIDAQRAERIRENLRRLQLQAEVKVADAAQTERWWDGQPFDAILLDAPCTASGIVRRHPDVPWLRRPTDVAQLAVQQARLLEALWPLLRPGGHLLYCTCSVFKAEGEQQMAAFGQRHPEAVALPAPGHWLPSFNQIGLGLGIGPVADNMDGFFYALWSKPF